MATLEAQVLESMSIADIECMLSKARLRALTSLGLHGCFAQWFCTCT